MKSRLHTRQVSFRQLEIFKAVVEMKSVTSASKSLFLAQSTVSTQLHKLTQAVGHPLFEFVGKSFYLTDIGQAVYDTADDVLNRLYSLEHRLDSHAQLQFGKLRIAVVTTANHFVPRWLGQFCQQYPGIDPDLFVGNRGSLCDRLKHNQDDLYIFSQPPQDIAISSTWLTDNLLVPIATPAHPLANQHSLSWEHLKQHRLLLRERGSATRNAVEVFMQDNAKPDVVPLTIASNEAIKESVLAGLGVGIVSRHVINDYERSAIIELNVDEFPLTNSWYIVTLKNKVMSPSAQAFMTFIQQCLQPEAQKV